MSAGPNPQTLCLQRKNSNVFLLLWKPEFNFGFWIIYLFIPWCPQSSCLPSCFSLLPTPHLTLSWQFAQTSLPRSPFACLFWEKTPQQIGTGYRLSVSALEWCCWSIEPTWTWLALSLFIYKSRRKQVQLLIPSSPSCSSTFQNILLPHLLTSGPSFLPLSILSKSLITTVQYSNLSLSFCYPTWRLTSQRTNLQFPHMCNLITAAGSLQFITSMLYIVYNFWRFVDMMWMSSMFLMLSGICEGQHFYSFGTY